MWAEKIKKITSFFLIFFLLFSFTFRVPFELFFSSSVFAGDKEFYNLVSVIVDEESYDDIKTKVIRYARDIQGVLENTKVVILPTPSGASALDIASLNESLYFEGYKSLEDVDYESRLIGTVLVGKIPVPIVFDSALSGKSVLPYVDFEDKAFIFNHENGKYEKNDDAQDAMGAEVWHGIISPNTGSADDDIQAIRDFFDKNHDFYTGQGVFDQEFGVLDGQNSEEPENYEPYVFYYDQFRENESLQYQSYVGYEMYLQNMEDITYNRYSKELAEKIKNQVLGIQNADIYELFQQVNPDFNISEYADAGPNSEESSDVLTRYITDNATNSFLEIFNGSTLGEMRKYIFNAGRYNDGGSRVNMDMPPFLVSVIDAVSSEVVKNVNDGLENEITNLVANGLSRKIAIPTGKSITAGPSTCSSRYTAFYNGKQASQINSARECSIYRGNTNSGTLVEANRGFNVGLTGDDINLCGADMRTNPSGVYTGLEGYWGGNSPAGLTIDEAGFETLELVNSNPDQAIRPIFDILGSKERTNSNRNPSPLDCFTNNSLILTYDEIAVSRGEEGDETCETNFQLPIGGNPAINWSCDSNNTLTPGENYFSIMDSSSSGFSTVGDGGVCENSTITLDGKIMKSNTQDCTGGGEDGCSCTTITKENSFKTIDSYILHTSPTDQEFGAQVGSMFTPSLPIDKNRYIDFIGAKGGSAPDYGYQRIDFPELFRIDVNSGEELTLENISAKVKAHLDEVSAEINAVINDTRPSSPVESEFSTGTYPDANIDLYEFLQSKPLEVFNSDNQSKEISYYDTLVFAVFWNNLDNVSSKYKFIFENYLSNQFEGNDYGFHLPKAKKSYEVGYFAAPGDAQNMYVKLDPEGKSDHPYADVMSRYLTLNTTLAANNIEESEYEEPTFECAPPDGVNIFQWIPAVICWLKNMLPPKIKIGTTSCGVEPFTDEQIEEIQECSKDLNANGINDCLEEKLASGSLLLYSDQGRYYYHSSGMISTEIYDNDDEIAFFDSNSYVKHELIRLEIPENSEEEFLDENVQVVYDMNDDSKNSDEDYENSQKYFAFQESTPRAFRGKANTYFYGKGEDVNAYFRSRLVIDDAQGERIVDLASNLLRVEVRGDRVLVNSFTVENAGGEYYAGSSITVGGSDNICLADTRSAEMSEIADAAYNISDAPEKLLLTLQNISSAGNTLSLSYPLDIVLSKDEKVFYEETEVSEDDLKNVKGFFNLRESGVYDFYVRDSNGHVAKKTIDVFADSAESLEVTLGSNILEAGSNISTHFVSIFDQFENFANSEIYSLEIEINGESIVFAENNETNIQYVLAEGYKAFRLKTTDVPGISELRFTLKNMSGDTIITTNTSLEVVDDIQLQITPLDGIPKVGGSEYRYRLEFTDGDGNLYENLNSRAYMNIEKLYGLVRQSYSEVVQGVSEISFRTKQLASPEVFLEFQLEGGNEIYKESTAIYPELPIKIDLSVSKEKMEASPEDSSILQITLKDRYNNDVFTDNSTQIFTEIAEKSSDIISFSENSKTVSRGKTQFEITGTDIPGMGYFRVFSEPDLSENSFNILGQRPFLKSDLTIPTMTNSQGDLTDIGKKFFREFSPEEYMSKFMSESALEQSEDFINLSPVLQNQLTNLWNETNITQINGLGENAGHVETFFFWDEEDIDGNAYNTLYSVLLGAEYGDITQENYLAGGMLFDRENSSLAVTSLLSNPYSFSDTLRIEETGNIILENTRDLTQDIELRVGTDDAGRIYIEIYNAALEVYIGRIYYTLSSDENISVEFIDGQDYSFVETDDTFIIKNSQGQSIFEIDSDGSMMRKSSSSLRMSPDSAHNDVLQFDILDAGIHIATMSVKQDFQVNISRDLSLLDTKLELLENHAVIYLASNSYSSRAVWGKENTHITKLYYHDPFAVKNSLNNLHENDGLGLESSYDEAGIGWNNPNMMLLGFSSGESVGQSSKNYQSFSLVNLGDPVVSLKRHVQEFPGTSDEKSFDSSLGTLLADEGDIVGFEVFDYNHDDKKDILTIYKDGYTVLLEGDNISGDFIRHGNLTYAADGGSPRHIKTGDFTGDGYDDIFFVNNSGEASLFNNHIKDFYRFDISGQFSLSGAIMQSEVFDMDHDGKDDIVTLDDAGEIHIFYGGGNDRSPEFTKKFVGDGYNLEIVSESQSYGGAIYFDGLTQIDPNDSSALSTLTTQYLEQMQEAIENESPDDIPNPQFVNDSLLQTLLYVELPYYPTDYELEDIDGEYVLEEFNTDINNLGEVAQGQGVGESSSVLSDFIENYDQYIAYNGVQSGYNRNTYFLRSQYADIEGIEVSKIFTDTTPPNLQTGDRVYYDITIKNTGSDIKENIAYVDTIPAYLGFATNTYEVISEPELELQERKDGIGNYSILLDRIYLLPGEEITVRYELETLPLSYGHIQVGLYEAGEIGDDEYGDIILKEDEKNCGREAKIYRSVAVRSYSEGMTTPVCDEDAIDIGNTFPELTDENDNGVPDYLEDLLESESNIGDISVPWDTDENPNNVSEDEINDYNSELDNNSSLQDIQDYNQSVLDDMNSDTDGDSIPDSDDSMDSSDSAVDFMGAIDQMNSAIDDVSAEIDEILQGFSCGFGGGSCFANPLNWAPLAPGNDPTLYGMPIGDGLRVGEGIPAFSALTGRQTSCGTSPCCLPSVYPANSATFVPGPFCGPPGAGGSRGVTSPTNFVRMFVTPTLTGGAGIAVCFGAPAIVRGNIPPQGVSPVAPGGNCIVAAMPLLGCEGGEGDPSGLGYPVIGDFGVIHANCDGNIGSELTSPLELSENFVSDYFDYLETGEMPVGMYDEYVRTFEDFEGLDPAGLTLPSGPLLSIGGGDPSTATTVDLDFSQLQNGGGLADVVQIQNTRTAGFPSFFMDWVERQLDEVTSKLTNLPKIYVILPDFGGIFDGGFSGFGQGMQDAFNKNSGERQENRTERSAGVDALRQSKSGLDCTGADALQCSRINLQIAAQSGENFTTNTNERLSGIKEVYEFIGNIPLVNIETQKVSVNVPWIDQSELARFSADWQFTLEEWKDELESKSQQWSMGASCEGTPEEISSCQEQNDIRQNAYLETSRFIASLERNIDVLEEYKRFPEKLAKLINIKEVWLEQILCNIDAISKLMGEWINTNGERFKAWVELYLLIKAILKSWQLFIDVFNDYDAECHECKNERQDLNNFTFQLVSAVIPSPPILEFPKWPDIILDFHNIRAGMTIDMPEFEMNMRPIVLPTLPDLSLPDVPTAGFTLPELPVLPMFELPELPELPALPTVELPDLPPPPKIPKLFGPVEVVLNIGKLVTKAMCIMKQSPFVPEWRAGDQIAFLTERNGYLPTDFIDLNMPAFSYSAVSAIKVTTYVNLEFEMEFLVEAVRAITAPIDKMTNNIVNMFDLEISNLDVSDSVPQNIDINLERDGEIETEISLAPLNENPEGIYMLAGFMASGMLKFLEKLSQDEGVMLSNKEFITHMNTQLASERLVADSATAELRNLWSSIQEKKYSKENEFISHLREHNSEKFETLGEIIATEIEYTKSQQEELKNFSTPEDYIKVNTVNDTRISQYNTMLEKYNIATLDAATQLLDGESEQAKSFQEDLEKEAKNMMQEVRGGLQSYRDNLLTAETGSSSAAATGGSCIGTGTYEYRYEGIYILEDGKNYKLFDYVDILDGDEVPVVSDIDNDGDEDVLYMVDGKLFFKENYKISAEKEYVSSLPIVLKSSDNKFFSGDIYYESVNGFTQGAVSDGALNINFMRPTDVDIKNFRIQYHTIVDKYLDEQDTFQPGNVKTHIIDAIAASEQRSQLEETSNYSIHPHLATLTYAGAMQDIRLTTEKLISVANELSENRQVILTRGTPLYAGGDDFEIEFQYSGSDEMQEITVKKYTQLSFNRPAEITAIRGDGYISLGILEDIEGTDLIDYIGKPLLLGSTIQYTGNTDTLDASSHIDIRYYDGSDLFLDIRDITSYTLYDLGSSSRDIYNVRIKTENDFYYARMQSFKENISGTHSQQILLAPQRYADDLAPQIGLSQKIRIPVYQQQRVSLTEYIYEDGGISNISDVSVDFFLDRDDDEDGNASNDTNTGAIQVNRSPSQISIDFGPFDEIFEKDIAIAVTDNNGNRAQKTIGFEVYPPQPAIENIEDYVISGAIDEILLDEPVRLYRYRGGQIQKLQDADGNDVINTDDLGNYSFEASETADGLVLSYSGSEIAQIDEYTGQIQLSDITSSTRVIPSNSVENTSVFPEIQIMKFGTPVFRQYIMMPEGEGQIVSDFNNLVSEGMYLRLTDGDSFGIYRVPLTAPYNPGSTVLYSSDDTEKDSLLTLFSDGRIHVNSVRYELRYRNYDQYVMLVLTDRVNGNEILEMLYKVDASYILN